MRTALDAPTDTLDEHEQKFVAKIREHGWFRTEVFGDDEGPGFSYTTGLWVGADHPELIIFSLRPDIAHDIFWDLFREAKAGRQLIPGKRTSDVFGNLPACVFP